MTGIFSLGKPKRRYGEKPSFSIVRAKIEPGRRERKAPPKAAIGPLTRKAAKRASMTADDVARQPVFSTSGFHSNMWEWGK